MKGSVSTGGSEKLVQITLFLILLAYAFPMFFDVYRIAYFKVVPYDDYARYLLFILGEPGGDVPPSPFVYRYGSVVLASPFYFLPQIPLTGGGAAKDLISYTDEYARALQALCAANVFFVFLSGIIFFVYTRLRMGFSWEGAFICCLVLVILGNYLSLANVDGMTIFPVVIMLIAVAEQRIIMFLCAVAIGTLLNEKVALISTIFVGLRSLFYYKSHPKYVVMTIISLIVLSAFFVIIATFPFPGAANQKDPTTYVSAILATLEQLTSAKGLYLVLWPPLLLSCLWGVGMLVPGDRRFVAISDIGLIWGLVAISSALDVQYNVGRIAMFSAPLFVIGACQWLALKSETSWRQSS